MRFFAFINFKNRVTFKFNWNVFWYLFVVSTWTKFRKLLNQFQNRKPVFRIDRYGPVISTRILSHSNKSQTLHTTIIAHANIHTQDIASRFAPPLRHPHPAHPTSCLMQCYMCMCVWQHNNTKIISPALALPPAPTHFIVLMYVQLGTLCAPTPTNQHTTPSTIQSGALRWHFLFSPLITFPDGGSALVSNMHTTICMLETVTRSADKQQTAPTGAVKTNIQLGTTGGCLRHCRARTSACMAVGCVPRNMWESLRMRIEEVHATGNWEFQPMCPWDIWVSFCFPSK